MKTRIIFFLLSLGISLGVKCQLIVESSRLDPYKKDIDTLYVRGKTVQFDFDTLYFVNRLLIQDYFSLIDRYNALRLKSIDLVDTFSLFNRSIQNDILRLNSNMDAGFQLVRDSLSVNNVRLDKWKEENAMLMTMNRQMSVDLKLAKNEIRGAKWNSLWQKLLFGSGGLVIGAGIGAIVVAAAN
jgi:hypothetical protein